MKTTFLLNSLLCAALVLLSGCDTTTVKRVDPKGTRTIDTLGMDERDWNEVSAAMVDSLRDEFVNRKLQIAPGKSTALMAISLIRNNTGIHMDTDRLVKRIREGLLATGKIETSTTIGIGGVEDPIAEEEKRRARLLGLDPKRPDYTLSGKVIDRRSRNGSVTEVSYIFQLSLTKNPEGSAVWEKEHVTQPKQAKRGVVGP